MNNKFNVKLGTWKTKDNSKEEVIRMSPCKTTEE